MRGGEGGEHVDICLESEINEVGERKKKIPSRVHTCGMKEKTIEEGRKGKRERGMVVFVCLYGRKKRRGGLFLSLFLPRVWLCIANKTPGLVGW